MQGRADVDLGGAGPTLAANDSHLTVALDARWTRLMVGANDLHTGAQRCLGPRQSLHVRFHAARRGRIILPQMTDAQSLPAISGHLPFAICSLHCAILLGRELQCRSYMPPGAH